MPDATATRRVRFGLAAKIFLAATLLVVVVLGLVFGLTSLQANRTADPAIRRALVGHRRSVQAFLAARTATFAAMRPVSVQVPPFRQLLPNPSPGDLLAQAQAY